MELLPHIIEEQFNTGNVLFEYLHQLAFEVILSGYKLINDYKRKFIRVLVQRREMTGKRVYIYSQTPVDVKLTDLQAKWPLEKKAKRLPTTSPSGNVTCISMLAHPFDSTGTGAMETNMVIHIMAVAPMYTVYKAVEEGEPLGKEFEEWKVAETDGYDLFEEVVNENPGQFRTVHAKQVHFPTEADANHIISSDLLTKNKRRWFSNAHGVIDQFVFRAGMKPCRGCSDGLSGRLFEGGEPLCRKCRPEKRTLGVTIRTAKVMNLSNFGPRVGAYYSDTKAKMVFAKKDNIVDEEYVLFGAPEDLPFESGDSELDQKAMETFLRSAKTAVYDIETVPVDAEMKKIPDEVITIQVVLSEGTKARDIVVLTRRMPKCWSSGTGIKDTNEFLKDVLTEEEIASIRKTADGKVPKLKVFHFKTERDLITGFVKLILRYRPHFLVSFNGEGFDAKFLLRASIATDMTPLNKMLDHLREDLSRRINSRKVVTPYLYKAFGRPHGWLCRGLISDKALVVGYDLFPCTVGVDLYKIEQCSLADACAKRKVKVAKMDSVKHTDIPGLYYGDTEMFWQYGILDPISTDQLLDKVKFPAIDVFLEMEALVGTPWNLSMSRKKTQNAICTQYREFISNGYLAPALIRPKSLLARVTVEQLVEYFFLQKYPTLPEAVQLVVDFNNGHCKCNTSFRRVDKNVLQGLGKNFSDVNHELTRSTLNTLLGYHKKNNIRSGEQYSTVDACIVLHYLSRDPECFKKVLEDPVFKDIMDDFRAMFNVKDMDKRAGQLAKFIAYLLEVRTVLSHRYEDPKLIWKMYKKNYKMDPIVTKLQDFAKQRHSDIISLAEEARNRYTIRRMNKDSLSVTGMVDAIVRVEENRPPIKLEMLPYDGALILYTGDEGEDDISDDDLESDTSEEEDDDYAPPQRKGKLIERRPSRKKFSSKTAPSPIKKGINMRDVVGVFDFKSQYPFSMIVTNLGKDTHVSCESVYKIINALLQNKRAATLEEAADILCSTYVNCCHTRRIDDMKSLKHYVRNPCYVKRNFVFFAKNPKSVQNQQFILEIESRVIDKRKSQDQSLPANVRKSHANRSETKKITINSRYGLIQSTTDPRFQAIVTGKGRESIRRVKGCLRRNMDTRVFYGDTDSCFIYKRGVTPFTMLEMAPREVYDELMFKELVGLSYNEFKEKVYDKHYPVDRSSPRAIREAAGRVKHALFVMMEEGLSSNYLEVEAEKTLNPIILPSAKKYIAHNCITGKPLTKGLSLNNKSASMLTKEILTFLYNTTVDSFDIFEMVDKVYHELGGKILPQIDYVTPEILQKIAKPTSFNLQKVKDGSKQARLLKRMSGDHGVTFMFDNIHLRVVPIKPIQGDLGWSLYDTVNQPKELPPGTELHCVKAKYDVLQETMNIMSATFTMDICNLFQSLVLGQYDSTMTRAKFEVLNESCQRAFKPKPLSRILKEAGTPTTPADLRQLGASTMTCHDTRPGIRKRKAARVGKRKVAQGVVYYSSPERPQNLVEPPRKQKSLEKFFSQMKEHPQSNPPLSPSSVTEGPHSSSPQQISTLPSMIRKKAKKKRPIPF